ncbi:hypothetical protein [Klenkia terrae]|uniref:Uncharacterized protein n=1 Tax=Klenkia terrae TaxID=1052259 RepID=A0ABU8E571_9ACTN|nr:hypothetical protein [Klenkia terrae]
MQPPSFDDRFSGAWSSWVLEHGLPAIPDQLGDGESVPVSWWSGPDTAAVLHLRRRPAEDDEPARTEVDVELFERRGELWDTGPGGGAGGWEEAALTRVYVPADHADLSGAVGGTGLIALWGEVGTAAASVEVEQDGHVVRRPVVAPLGWVVVSTSARRPSTVRVRDAGERVLLEQPAPPAGWGSSR